MSNPETTLCWHPLQTALNKLKISSLRGGTSPPHWDRVENMAGSGTPDLSWSWASSEGWIELKHRHDVPVREETPVSLPTVTPEQRLWWKERWRAGGNVYVLLRMENQFYLFEGLWACHNLGSTTLRGLQDHAVLQCDRSGLVAEEVMRCASRR